MTTPRGAGIPSQKVLVQILIEHNEDIRDFCLFVCCCCCFCFVVVLCCCCCCRFMPLDSPVGFFLVSQTYIHNYIKPRQSIRFLFILFLFVCCLPLLLLCVCVGGGDDGGGVFCI